MKKATLLTLALSLVACQKECAPAEVQSQGAPKTECDPADLCNRLRGISKEVNTAFLGTYADPMDMLYYYQLALVEIGAKTQELGCDCPEAFYEIPPPIDPVPQCP